MTRSAVFTAAPAVAIAFVCCLMPLVWMAGAVLLNPDVRSEIWLTEFRAGLLLRTVGYNGAAALIATAMGLPAAVVLGRGRGWLARVLWLVLPVALLMPSLSYAYGWSQCLRLLQMFVVDFSTRYFGQAHAMRIPTPAGGPVDVFRCIWSLASWLWAVPAGLIGLSLRQMDTAVQQQAALDGALWRTTFRLMRGPIVASVAIVTVLGTQEFAVYEPTGISVVATEVRMVFDTGAMSSVNNSMTVTMGQGGGARASSPDQAARAGASVAATLPLLGCTTVLAVLAVWGASRSETDVPTTGTWPRVLDAPAWAVWLTLLLVVLNVGVPVWSLVHSLRIPFSLPSMFNEFAPEVEGAIFVAAVAAGVAAVSAFSAAGRWMPGLMAVAAVTFLIGGQLLAIALIRIYNHPWLDWAYGAFPVPVIAYVGRFGWLALAGARGAWGRGWRELREMASLDGAGAFRTAVSVVWPLAWPTLVAGALLVGALSMTEVPATVLLFPNRPQVLTPTLMTWLHQARSDSMIEASLLMMIGVLVPVGASLVLFLLGRKLTSRIFTDRL